MTPGSTMTNAAVDSMVASNDGQVLMMKYKDGEKTYWDLFAERTSKDVVLQLDVGHVAALHRRGHCTREPHLPRELEHALPLALGLARHQQQVGEGVFGSNRRERPHELFPPLPVAHADVSDDAGLGRDAELLAYRVGVGAAGLEALERGREAPPDPLHRRGGEVSQQALGDDHQASGRLELDRPNQGRLDAVYNAPWGLSAGLQFYVRTGTPTSILGDYGNGYDQELYLSRRGYAGRLPTDYEMNASLGYNINVGPVTTPGL